MSALLEECNSASNCPGVHVLPSGDYAVVGYEPDAEVWVRLPDGVSVGPRERLVVVPRTVMLAASARIAGVPDA